MTKKSWEGKLSESGSCRREFLCGSFGKVKAENPSEAYLSRFSDIRRFGRLDEKKKSCEKTFRIQQLPERIPFEEASGSEK